MIGNNFSNDIGAGIPKAIIWDLDGTLVDSAADLTKALNALMNEQGHWGHNVDSVRTMIGDGVAKLIERGFQASDVEISRSERDAMVPRFLEIYTRCATDETRLVPHAEEVLEYFYNKGVRQGICTNKPEAVTRQILSTLDVSGYFGSVIGGDSTPHRKPHPLTLQTCMQELRVGTGECIMVGDSAADVGAARAAGVPVILVPDGYTGAPAESLDADLVLQNLSALPREIQLSRPVQKTA